MDLFEWIRDFERLYKNLINDAKDINLKDIEEFRDQQRNQFERFIETKNDLVNEALVKLATDGETQIQEFESQIEDALKKIELQFQKEVAKLHTIIIDEMGLDF